MTTLKTKIIELRKTRSANAKYLWVYHVIDAHGKVLHERKSSIDYAAAALSENRVSYLKTTVLPIEVLKQSCDALALTFEALKQYYKIR